MEQFGLTAMKPRVVPRRFFGEHEVDVLDHVLDVGHVLDDHVLDELRHRGFHLPAAADGLLVGLAGAVRGRGKGDQFEPRMVFEQRHEALSDHARSSENADLNLFGHNNLSLMLERFRMISRLRSTSRPQTASWTATCVV